MFTGQKKEHSFRVFSRDIKENNFGDVILMYGVEEYLIEWAVNSLVEKYVSKGAISLDYIKLDDDSQSVDFLLNACDTFSMFSEKRIVWAKDFPLLKSVNPKGYTNEDKQKLLDYVANPNSSTLVIFSIEELEGKSELVKYLQKNAKTYNFEKLEKPELLAFCEKRFKAEGTAISRDNLRYLVDETGYFNKETQYRIFNLVNDIKKLCAYTEGQEVRKEDIDSILNGDLDTFAFNFLDAVTSNKKETAFSLLHNILSSGEDVFSIVGLLVNHFELILCVKEFKEEGMNLPAIVGTLKMHEFRVKKAMGFCDRFSANKLKEILIELYEIDRNIKNGLLSQELALELLVGRI